MALEVLQCIPALYQIEAKVRGQPAEIRLATRAAKSTPLCNDLKIWLERNLARISCKSDLPMAIRYMLSRWQALFLR